MQCKTICLICNESVSVNKEYNLKWHHEVKHISHNKNKPSEPKEKVEKLIGNLDRQQTTFKKQNADKKGSTKARYIVSYLIVKLLKSYTEGEFTKEYTKEVFPEKKGAFENINLPTKTVIH